MSSRVDSKASISHGVYLNGCFSLGMPFVCSSSYLCRSNMPFQMIAVAPTLSSLGASYDVLIILLVFSTM